MSVVATLETLNLEPENLQKLSAFFSQVKSGDYVSPEALAAQQDVPVRTCFRVCEYLVQAGLAEAEYEPQCSRCHNVVGLHLESLVNYDRNTECEFCFKPLNMVDDIRFVVRLK